MKWDVKKEGNKIMNRLKTLTYQITWIQTNILTRPTAVGHRPSNSPNSFSFGSMRTNQSSTKTKVSNNLNHNSI